MTPGGCPTSANLFVSFLSSSSPRPPRKRYVIIFSGFMAVPLRLQWHRKAAASRVASGGPLVFPADPLDERAEGVGPGVRRADLATDLFLIRNVSTTSATCGDPGRQACPFVRE